MLGWAVVFFIVSIIAGLLGFGGVAAASATFAQILFFVFLVLFLITLAIGVGLTDKILGRNSKDI